MPNRTALLNTNTMTAEATAGLLQLDKSFIGTDNYLGLAYFWNHAYRWPMREVSYAERRRVHKAFIKAGLLPSALSDEHEKLIEEKLGFNVNGADCMSYWQGVNNAAKKRRVGASLD